MTALLHDSLLAPETKPALIDDCLALIEHEVSVMSGYPAPRSRSPTRR